MQKPSATLPATAPSSAPTKPAGSAQDAARTIATANWARRPDGSGPGTTPSPAPANTPDLVYQTTLLDHPITIRIAGAIPAVQRQKAKSRFDEALRLILAAKPKLTPQQKEVLGLLRSIVVVVNSGSTVRTPGKETGMDVGSRVFTFLITYVLDPGTNGAWLASVIAHDSFHIWQSLHGQSNTVAGAAQLERDADDFQIAVGKLLGLSDAQIKYLQADRHTYYNTRPY